MNTKYMILVAIAIMVATYSYATQQWPMHKIDNISFGHNSLSAGDLNGDGFMDYAIVLETAKQYSFILHPGKDGDVKAPWKKVFVGKGKNPNPEYSHIGDFDGDGRMDIVGVCGAGASAKIFWGPESARLEDSEAWNKTILTQTEKIGHWGYVIPKDINGDGALDIVIGGRILGTHSTHGTEGKPIAGIRWLEAPLDPKTRRDPARWVMHNIDSKCLGGHGFQFHDVDQDGDEDIINTNADWNTLEEQEHLVWYENPGSDSPTQKEEWPQHMIYKGSEFFGKTQFTLSDLDGDGLTDICISGKDAIFWFRKTSVNPVQWEKIVIPKDEKTKGLQRIMAIADMNGDGKLDLVGMLMADNKSILPKDKAAVFMMTYSGDRPAADNWSTEVIKWSDGWTLDLPWRGEKWDHCHLLDLDRDGDLDILGQCTEYNTKDRVTIIGVAWFENPRIQPSK